MIICIINFIIFQNMRGVLQMVRFFILLINVLENLKKNTVKLLWNKKFQKSIDKS